MFKIFEQNGLYGLTRNGNAFLKPYFSSIIRTKDSYIFDGHLIKIEFLKVLVPTIKDCIKSIRKNRTHHIRFYKDIQYVSEKNELTEKKLLAEIKSFEFEQQTRVSEMTTITNEFCAEIKTLLHLDVKDVISPVVNNILQSAEDKQFHVLFSQLQNFYQINCGNCFGCALKSLCTQEQKAI